jgi:predicted DsbA family dithiol-disulfide isomerase
MAAHRAAVEAQRQGGDKAFWQMHDKIFENSRDLSHATLIGYAQDMGLDTRAFTSALTSDKHDARISADVDMAEAADINGTPHFIINGYSISGAQPFSAFKRVIDKALAGK